MEFWLLPTLNCAEEAVLAWEGSNGIVGEATEASPFLTFYKSRGACVLGKSNRLSKWAQCAS